MNAINTNQINVIEVLPSIYTVSSPTQREINYLVSWVRSEKQVTFYTASMVLESRVIDAAIKAGEIVEVDGVLMIPVVEVEEVPAAETNVDENTEQCAISSIDKQVNQLANSSDPAFRQAGQLYKDCLNGDWLDQLVAEIESGQQEQQEEIIMDTLELPGMKCKNIDRDDDYWFFVGDRKSAFFSVELLAQDGIYTSARPNGGTGCYAVKVPRWVKGKLVTVVGREKQAA